MVVREMSCFMENSVATDEDRHIALKNSIEVGNKRKKKFTGGNASKRHRDRVNVEFHNLAKLLPFPESVIAKLDKSSILRLAVSYIRAKSFFKDITHVVKRETKPCKQIKEGSGIVSEIFSQALDGFLLVLTEDMKVLFVSESVRDYLGYCQAGIIHENFLQFVNPSDSSIIQNNMSYRKDEADNKANTSPKNINRSFNPNQFLVRGFESRGKSPVSVARHFVCRMKCAYSCSSRFYTAYRTFQFTGHLRNSTIQEGREQKNLNTLVVFASPLASSTDTGTPVDVPKCDDQIGYKQHIHTHKDYIPYERYTTGFRIEPTLRPHIAPIPVSSKEQAEHRPPSVTSSLPSRHHSVPVSTDVYPRELPRLISRSSISSYSLKSYPETFSNESRYSDQSDDSKCSPASSPNLIWKQRKSPGFIPYEERNKEMRLSVEDFERIRRKSLLEQEYWLSRRASPDLYEVESNRSFITEPTTNMDVFRGASMLMNLRQHGVNSSRSNSPEYYERRKRSIDDCPEDYRLYKRQKTFSDTKRRNFNISSLLGLEENSNTAIDDIMQRKTSAFIEISRPLHVYRSNYDNRNRELRHPICQ